MKRSQHVYQIIKKMIIQGRMMGLMSENELSERLNISRTPLREALSRLIAEGWIVEHENRNKFIKPISAKEIKDIFEIRADLEAIAINLAWDKIDAKDINFILQDLQEAYANQDQRELSCIDNKLHHFFVKMTNNEKLAEMLIHTEERLSMVRNHESVGNTLSSAKEHIHICQSLMSGNKESTLLLVRNHIKNSYLRLISNTAYSGPSVNTNLNK